MTLGQKILNLRKKAGFSQEELGEKIEVTRQTISNWELDETSPNPEQLKLLSKVLNVSIDDLLSNEIAKSSDEKEMSDGNNKKSSILRYLFIGFIILLIIDIVTFIILFVNKMGPFEENKMENNVSCVVDSGYNNL